MTPSASTRVGWPKAHPQRADRQRPGGQAAQGSINHGLMHVADIMPTLLEIAGRQLSEKPTRDANAAADWQVVEQGPGRQADSVRTEQDYLAWRSSQPRVRQGD